MMPIILMALLNIISRGGLKVSCYTLIIITVVHVTTELDEFMAVLDRRVLKSQANQPVGLVAKKVRRVGEPSTEPPPGAPSWTVKPHKSLHIIFTY